MLVFMFFAVVLTASLPSTVALLLQDVSWEPMLVPDIFFDLANSTAELIQSMENIPPFGDTYKASKGIASGQMIPFVLWKSSKWWMPEARNFDLRFQVAEGQHLHIAAGGPPDIEHLAGHLQDPSVRYIQCIYDQTAAMSLHDSLKGHPNFDDSWFDRLLVLPVAITREPMVFSGFRSVLGGPESPQQCRGVTVPSGTALVIKDGCSMEAANEVSRSIVPAVSLDSLITMAMQDTASNDSMMVEVHLRLDANEALPDVLNTLRSLPLPIFTMISEIEVIYHKEDMLDARWRHDLFGEVRLLGFDPVWDLKDERCEVRYSCRIFHDREECIFRRVLASDAWVRTNSELISWFMREPYGFIRLESGTGSAISRQFATAQRNHVQACIGPTIQCFNEWIRREPFLQMASLIQPTWVAEEYDGSDVNHYFYLQIVDAAYEMLHREDWEAMHWTGAAYTLFTLLVEGLCRHFPMQCGPDPALKGLHGFRPGTFEDPAARHPKRPLCSTLSECQEIYQELGLDHEAFVQRAGHLVELFRSAQFVSAPTCMPASWNMEMVDDGGMTFPSVLVESDRALTALAADSSSCGLEVSVVVLLADLDGEEVQMYRGNIMELFGPSRDLEAADIRLPTEGEDWIFDCIFFRQGMKALRVGAEQRSRSLLQELEGYINAPVLTIHCDTPPELLAEGPPDMVQLERSARSAPHVPWFSVEVPLRQSQARKVRTAMCTQQTWDASFLEDRAPGHIELWFHYHFEVLGIDQIYLYDLDGTFADLEVLRPWRSAGRLISTEGFAKIPPLDRVYNEMGFNTASAYLAQTLVQHHCLQQAKHNAEWIISVSHGWDMVLFSPTQTLGELLDGLSENKLTYVNGVRYGDPESESTNVQLGQVRKRGVDHGNNVFTRYPQHNDLGLRPETRNSPEERIIIGSPRLLDGILCAEVALRIDSSLFSSLRQGYGFCERGDAEKSDFHIVDPSIWRANHYVELLGRKLLYNGEKDFPELRAFDLFDDAAFALGERLQNLSQQRDV